MDILNLFYIVITIYSDTDSIFTTKKLDDKYIGTGLGLMKDELTGNRISEMLVLDCKQYGYYYFDKGNKIEKSVWAGITRNSLSFKDLLHLFSGRIIQRIVNNRFFKSLQNLNISIKNVKLTISYKPHKKLLNNNYLPIYINYKLDIRKDPKLVKLNNILLKLRRDIKQTPY